jgi:hypothetical protein
VTARHLAEFLESVEAEETLLSQRLSDLESSAVRLGLTNRIDTEGSGTIPHCSEGAVRVKEDGLRDELVADEIYGEF